MKFLLSKLELSEGAFERECGLSKGFVSSIGDSIRETTKKKISTSFPNINMNWVLTGEGAMFNSGRDKANESSDYSTRPRIPLTAAPGSLSYEERGVILRECEQMPIVNQFPAYDFTMFIKGDSMSPKYESGDEIACRWVNQERFIQWGKVHVLDTTQGIIVKKVYEDGDKIKCVSINSDYPPFSVPKEDIHSMSLVVGSLSIIEM